MAHMILADITSEFKTEISECGSASKCYCITCTRKRATTFKLFAAWRQVVRDQKNRAPVTLNVICNKYATSKLQFNEVVQIVQYHGNCNGHYAAGIAAEIITYTNPPTASVVAIEHLNGALLHPEWVGRPEVLTYWYDPFMFHGVSVNYYWVRIERQKLFKYFNECYMDAIMPDVQHAFDKLRRSVPMLSSGKFKNQLYILSSVRAILNGNETIELNHVTSQGDVIGYWHQYWYYLEKVVGM